MSTYLSLMRLDYELSKLGHEDRLRQAAYEQRVPQATASRLSLLSWLGTSTRRREAHKPLLTRHVATGLVALCLLLVSTLPAAANEIYLPLVVNAQNTVSATGIANGNFEAGATEWAAKSNHGHTVIRKSFDDGVTPRGGSYAAWMGRYALEFSTIQQQISVPADKPYLVYWHWIVSGDQCLRDKATVLINSTTVDSYLLCADAETGSWQKHLINLSAYAGQSVSLTIQLQNDGSRNSNLYIDDVGFEAAG